MNIAIAGGGIAGLAAAAFLKRAGHAVSVFDKAAEPAPVGSGLIIQPTGQAALKALGLADDVAVRGTRLKRLDGRLEDGERRVLDVRYEALGEGVSGVAVHRSVLFDSLHSLARKAGARFFYGREVAGAEQSETGVRLNFYCARAAGSFDLVIDSLGLRSPFIDRQDAYLDYGALWANVPLPQDSGFPEHVLTQRYRGAGISAGVMPIGVMRDGGVPHAALFWTLRADHEDAWRLTPLDRWKDKVRAFWPETTPLLETLQHHDQFVFAQYAHDTTRRPVAGRLVHIGDAWHAASPQLGQGANMALLDAWALSVALTGTIANGDSLETALKTFVNMRQHHVRLYQSMSGLFTPVYQSDSKILPALRDKFAEPLSQFWFMPKLLAAMVAGTLGGPLKKLPEA